MAKCKGTRAAVLDWEDLVHRKLEKPIKGGVKVKVGEQVRFEFPVSCQNEKYIMECKTFCSNFPK